MMLLERLPSWVHRSNLVWVSGGDSSSLYCQISRVSRLQYNIPSIFFSKEYRVRAGELNPRLEGSEERLFQKYENHPDYDNIAFYNDVALVFLDQPFVFDEKIQAICLPDGKESSDEISNWALQVQGWAPSSVNNLNKLFLTEITVRVRFVFILDDELKIMSSDLLINATETSLVSPTTPLSYPSSLCRGSCLNWSYRVSFVRRVAQMEK